MLLNSTANRGSTIQLNSVSSPLNSIPMQFGSSHFRCDATPCCSNALQVYAIPMRFDTGLFLGVSELRNFKANHGSSALLLCIALPFHAYPKHVEALLRCTLAYLSITFPLRCSLSFAIPLPFQFYAKRFMSALFLCYATALSSVQSRRISKHRLSIACRFYAFPLQSIAIPLLFLACQRQSIAPLHLALPPQLNASLFRSSP